MDQDLVVVSVENRIRLELPADMKTGARKANEVPQGRSRSISAAQCRLANLNEPYHPSLGCTPPNHLHITFQGAGNILRHPRDIPLVYRTVLWLPLCLHLSVRTFA